MKYKLFALTYQRPIFSAYWFGEGVDEFHKIHAQLFLEKFLIETSKFKLLQNAPKQDIVKHNIYSSVYIIIVSSVDSNSSFSWPVGLHPPFPDNLRISGMGSRGWYMHLIH